MQKKIISRSLANLNSFKFGCCAPKLPQCDYTPPKYSGSPSEKCQELRSQYCSPAFFYYYSKPFFLSTGKGQYVWDDKGKRYLDLFAGITTISIGYNHPKQIKYVTDQVKTLLHCPPIYLNNQVCEYAEMLAKKMPGKLTNFFFTNSGSEANDLAINLARAYTRNYDILNLRHAYHGCTSNAMGLIGIKSWKQNIPQGFGVHSVRAPYPYRGEHGNNGAKYAEDVLEVINTCTPGNIAGFIAEQILGVGGAIPLADGFLKKAYEYVRAAGGLCISDEVQAGLGRTGNHFWGFQNQGVIPDIVTMAKGVGNGLPIGVVATTDEIASVMKGKLYFNTFGGNPVSMAGAKAVLEVIEEEKLQENCKIQGDRFLAGLKELQKKHKCIGDVRGQGLCVGMEMVADQKTKEPIPAQDMAKIFDRSREEGIIIGKAGILGNIFRMFPPYCLTKEDVDFALQAIDRSLEGY